MRKLSGLTRSTKVAPTTPDQPEIQNGDLGGVGQHVMTALVAATSPPTASRPESRLGKRFIRYDNSWRGNSLGGGNGRAKPSAIEQRGEEEGTTASGDEDPINGLIKYFSNLSQTEFAEDVDFDKIEHLLALGADVNAVAESTGQSVFHDIASNWDTDVANFMLEKGADLHAKDNNGRTPLHVAAGSDHKEMVVWLLEHGAQLEERTQHELQTPIHYAARNDALNSLHVLVKWEGDYEVRDYMGRTPLHLAAELDRTLAADYLLSLDIPAECRVIDNYGNHAITSMIRTMPKTALHALNQLHRVAPADRKQFFLLSHLEPEPGTKQDYGVKTPFETAVEEESHDILSHPVMQELIQQKWKMGVRWFFFLNLGLYIVFLLTWSLLIAYPAVQQKHKYIFPRDIWRIILEILAVGLYIKQIVDEVMEYVRSKRKHKHYTRARSRILRDDLKNTDSTQPEEKKYLESELIKTNKSPSNYFKDPWNIIDIITYVTLGALIVLHAVDIGVHREQLAIWTARISCAAAVLIWVRLLNHARGFRAFGPLVAIIGQLIGDILRYFALYAVFFIPYVICFWVLFGGEQANGVDDIDDLTKFYRIAIMMFRMSLIDDYPYMALRSIDELMSAILVITFLLFTAVVGLNLFIALLSDTFQRVYDNAQANAILQQARIILSHEESMPTCNYQRYLRHIHDNCNPKTLFYDDDDTSKDQPAKLHKITHQIHDIVSELKSHSQMEGESKISELAGISETLAGRLEQQEEKMLLISQHLVEIKTVLFALQQQSGRLSVRAPPTLEDTQDDLHASQATLTSVESFHGGGGGGGGGRDTQQSGSSFTSPLVHSRCHHHHSNRNDDGQGPSKPVKLPPLGLPEERDSVTHGSSGHTSGTSQGGSTARTKYSDVMSPRTRQILYGDQHSQQQGSMQRNPWQFTAIEALYSADSYASLGGSSTLSSPSHRRIRKRKSRQEELEETKWMRKLQLAKTHQRGTNY